ncbi:hypothetical protein SMCF_8636, partial [Streptomyces coelicoflavus ZG0656]
MAVGEGLGPVGSGVGSTGSVGLSVGVPVGGGVGPWLVGGSGGEDGSGPVDGTGREGEGDGPGLPSGVVAG